MPTFPNLHGRITAGISTIEQHLKTHRTLGFVPAPIETVVATDETFQVLICGNSRGGKFAKCTDSTQPDTVVLIAEGHMEPEEINRAFDTLTTLKGLSVGNESPAPSKGRSR